MITKVEIEGGQPLQLSETTTLTQPLTQREIADAITDVVARADRGYAAELVLALQVRARMAEDSGERVTLEEFALKEGFDLAQLRAE